ncbi:hypothetical protein DXG01_009473, partial [Tephrocybe rancida]
MPRHYDTYKARCAEKKIAENHWAIPHNIWREIEESKNGKKKDNQHTLEFEVVQGIKEFSHEEVLDHVAQLTSRRPALASKPVFRNVLVSMRPRATAADLPSTHDVKVHIHNKYIEWLGELKNDIMEAPGKVSVTTDGWSEDKMRAAYL